MIHGTSDSHHLYKNEKTKGIVSKATDRSGDVLSKRWARRQAKSSQFVMMQERQGFNFGLGGG